MPGILQTVAPNAANTLANPLGAPATTPTAPLANTLAGTPPAAPVAANTATSPPSLPGLEKWTVTPDQTVEGRVGRLTDPNNPLIQQARARSDQAMNGRGLLNSSMAQTAADSAAYDVAIPIANADAGIAAKAANYNVDSANQLTTSQNLMLQKFGYDKSLVEIQKASNKEIAGIEAQYKNLTQASSSAASIMNNLSTNVAKIMENTTLNADAKQKAINIYNANATKSLQLIGALSGDIDLSDYLDTVLGTTGTPAPATTLPPPTTPTGTPMPTPATPANPYNPEPIPYEPPGQG